ncbi:MAG: Hsp20 family protein [Alphaproteobacteria bacterium]|nr:Hsp20 family protein [Alphaproteobacteria bacterium]
MNRMSVFSSPFLLGFDEIEARLDRLSRGADGYPPYNIERRTNAEGAELFMVSVAVAGFVADELDVVTEDGQLIIRGRQTEAAGREYLHRGIATRQFQRSFLLADGMKVTDAELKDGLLSVTMERPLPKKISQRIAIRTAPTPKRSKDG